jgi:2'-hydroxyisoflavone reductase
MPGRREFLHQAVAAGATLALSATPAGAGDGAQPGAAKRLRILILGATGNIGPYHVRAAVARGHRVAIFSRGRSAAEIPAEVERLLGDRNGDLSSIKGRDWDAVLDIATYGPGWVRTLGEALRGRVGHYTFISTISVYDNPAANPITEETSRVLAYRGSSDPYAVTTEGPDYGAIKVLCEQEAERQFPAATLIIRPGYIAGPGDTHPALPYWLLRMQRGGEVLAAGNPSTPVQFIDVRDLGEWITRMIERRGTGTYNALGPLPATDLAGVIDAARVAAPVPPVVTWVPSSWLATRKDKEQFAGLLFWEFNKGYLSGISNRRAVDQGLTTRSVRVTLADTHRWLRDQPPQQEVLLGYRPKADRSGFEPVRLAWPAYLEREQALLAAWHARRRRQSSD